MEWKAKFPMERIRKKPDAVVAPTRSDKSTPLFPIQPPVEGRKFPRYTKFLAQNYHF